jgi:hypothetical protein
VDDAQHRATNGPSLTPFQRGLWGGLVVLGRATINSAESTVGNAATPKYDVYEGLDDTVINGQNIHRYGGNDDDDNSGIIRFVSTRHGGTQILPNKELNGLSLGGVGRGTTVEFVEAYAIADAVSERSHGPPGEKNPAAPPEFLRVKGWQAPA